MPKINKRRQFLNHLLITSIAITSSHYLTGCSDSPKATPISKGSTIVALGDSLTYGYGTDPKTAYPEVLTELTGWKVVNKGVNGDTSSEVLDRVDEVIEKQPKLVLLGVGGNDVLRKVAPATTKENITATIAQLKDADIPVVLIAEPHFSTSALFGSASDNPIYEEIAELEKIPLFDKGEGGWSKILSDDSLKSDQIHANTAGYRLFSENLYEFLEKEGFIN